MTRRRVAAAIAAFSLGIAGAVAVSAPAHAAEIEVVNENDAGPGSLRQAIADANSGDTIVFDDAVSVIILESEIDILKGITIDGGGDVVISRVGPGDFGQLHFSPDIADQDFVLRDITLEGQPGVTGGAISVSNAGGESPRNITVSGVTVRDQRAGYPAIGEWSAVVGDILIENSTFERNQSTGGSGSLVITGGTPTSVVVRDSVFRENESAGDGGAISFDTLPTAPEVRGTSFESNAAAGWGGAIFADDLPGLLVVGDGDDSTWDFENNSAGQDGGAIAVRSVSGAVTIQDADFRGNESEQDGGAVYAGNIAGTIVIERVNADDNDAGQDGGAFFLNSATSASISDVRVEGSDADRNGGVAFLSAPAVSVALSLFANNTAVDGGGALYINGVWQPSVVRDSTFSRNDAETGGAVDAYISDSVLTFSRNTFAQNESTTRGAAIDIDSIDQDAMLLVDSNTFWGQTLDPTGQVGPGFAASLYVEDIEGVVDIVNSTFDENLATASAVVFTGVENGASTMVRHSTMRGGASIWYVELAEAEHAIENTILEALGPAAILVDDASGQPVQLRYSIVSTGIPAAGVTDVEGNELNLDPELGPLQHNGGTGTMWTRMPQEGSPAIDKGDPGLVGAPAFDERGAGFPRIQNGRVDIGAVEVQPALSTTGGEFPWAAAILGLLALGIGATALVITRRRTS